MRKLLKFLTSRLFLVSILILVQACILLAFVSYLSETYAPIAGFFWILSAFFTVFIINKQSNPIVKIPWILLFCLAPIFGGLLYLIFGSSKLKRNDQKILSVINSKIRNIYPKRQETVQNLNEIDPLAASQSKYITNVTSIPLYQNNHVEYFKSGEDFFPAFIEELKKATKYIFLEYFIIQEGLMWNTILEILLQKVKQGVEVRIIYDDVGSVNTLPYKYDEFLENQGISCIAFNPYRPALRTILHNRDHRKICVIDGIISFTGGLNLADEYINKIVRFGYWKDSATMIKGEASYAFALSFLELWGLYRGIEKNYEKYKPDANLIEENSDFKGFIQPYNDSPLDSEHTGELVYLNIINHATKYIYITTPYLIVDNEMTVALQLASKRGVDVRIITPHIPDKKIVFELTRASYRDLIEAGVKIFEFTPGFMHAKTVICDDKIATNGTFNFDFRSLYHHFECGLWMYGTKTVSQMKEDFLQTEKQCEEITPDFVLNTPITTKIKSCALRIFAPLL